MMAAASKHLEFLTEDITVVHYSSRGDLLYWAGEGWTTERGDAMVFSEIEKAMAERRRAKRANPLTRITLHIEGDS